MRSAFFLDWLLPLAGLALIVGWVVTFAAPDPALSRFERWSDAVLASRAVVVYLLLVFGWWLFRALKGRGNAARMAAGTTLQVAGFLLFSSMELKTVAAGILLFIAGLVLVASRQPAVSGRHNGRADPAIADRADRDPCCREEA